MNDTRKGLNEIDGMTLNTPQGEVTVHLLPPEVIDINIEILRNHPKLKSLLSSSLQEDNFNFETYFGCIAAYCGIVLDSTHGPGGYKVAELYEQLGRALVNKREAVAVGVNTMPTAQTLIGNILEMKQAHDEQEVESKKIVLIPSGKIS